MVIMQIKLSKELDDKLIDYKYKYKYKNKKEALIHILTNYKEVDDVREE